MVLTPRQELILRKVVETHTATGMPVGSKALAADPEVEAGHRDVVAPPMFCVVYCGPALGPALFDPELGIDFARLVHGGQQFEWGPLVVAGDEITTTVSVKEVSSRGPLGFFTFESVSTNQDGDTVCVGTWTNIVRGA